jgi:hypothetical protein
VNSYPKSSRRSPLTAGEILSLQSVVQDAGARIGKLLSVLGSRHPGALRFRKVHPMEIPGSVLERLGFCPAGAHRLYQTHAVSA